MTSWLVSPTSSDTHWIDIGDTANVAIAGFYNEPDSSIECSTSNLRNRTLLILLRQVDQMKESELERIGGIEAAFLFGLWDCVGRVNYIINCPTMISMMRELMGLRFHWQWRKTVCQYIFILISNIQRFQTICNVACRIICYIVMSPASINGVQKRWENRLLTIIGKRNNSDRVNGDTCSRLDVENDVTWSTA